MDLCIPRKGYQHCLITYVGKEAEHASIFVYVSLKLIQYTYNIPNIVYQCYSNKKIKIYLIKKW